MAEKGAVAPPGKEVSTNGLQSRKALGVNDAESVARANRMQTTSPSPGSWWIDPTDDTLAIALAIPGFDLVEQDSCPVGDP